MNKILIAGEFTGIVRDAFLAKGHNVISCDLLPTESPGPHYQGDVMDILYDDWDMIIAHPPCTFLSTVANAWWNVEKYGIERVTTRYILRSLAAEFFMLFVDHPCPQICIENPQGIMSTYYRKPHQVICPTSFDSRIPKRTHLWLKGLPPLMATKKFLPTYRYFKEGKRRETPIIADTLSFPIKERGKERSRFFPGIAKAMADQWGSF